MRRGNDIIAKHVLQYIPHGQGIGEEDELRKEIWRKKWRLRFQLQLEDVDGVQSSVERSSNTTLPCAAEYESE